MDSLTRRRLEGVMRIARIKDLPETFSLRMDGEALLQNMPELAQIKDPLEIIKQLGESNAYG